MKKKKKNRDLCLYVLSTLALLGLLNIIPHLFIYLIIIILVWHFTFLKKKKKKFGILSILFPILDRVIVALEDQTCLFNLKFSMDKFKSIFCNLAIIKFFYGILVEITHTHTHKGMICECGHIKFG